MLYLIGLGLNGYEDLSLRAVNVIEKANKIFLENYTSVPNKDIDELRSKIKKIELLNRDDVEKNPDKFLNEAKNKSVVVLIVGDVFSATTHIDLFLRAKNKGIDVKIINNVSIMTAVGITGLELYKFGKITSIVFPEKDWFPETPYFVIKDNLSLGLHTLCLLDIKVREQSKEDLLKGVNRFQKQRFMTVNDAIKILLELEKKNKLNVFNNSTLCVGVARLGSDDFVVKAGRADELLDYDFGAPLHSLIVPGKLHFVEEEMMKFWRI